MKKGEGNGHRHRAVFGAGKQYPWTACVWPGRCMGRSHGGVVFIDVCKCGALRGTESKGKFRNRGQWYVPPQEN